MSKLMKHRTDNDIKNKWYAMKRKEARDRASAIKKEGKQVPSKGPPNSAQI